MSHEFNEERVKFDPCAFRDGTDESIKECIKEHEKSIEYLENVLERRKHRGILERKKTRIAMEIIPEQVLEKHDDGGLIYFIPEREKDVGNMFWTTAYLALTREECENYFKDPHNGYAHDVMGEKEGIVIVRQFCHVNAMNAMYKAIIECETGFTCDQLGQGISLQVEDRDALEKDLVNARLYRFHDNDKKYEHTFVLMPTSDWELLQEARMWKKDTLVVLKIIGNLVLARGKTKMELP